MDLKKTYSKLSSTQKQNILLLAQGAFPWAITPASRTAMRDRWGLLDEGNNLLNKDRWVEFLADKLDPGFCPYCHGLDHTGYRQLEAIQAIYLGQVGDVPAKQMDRLKRKGFVVDIGLTPELARIWPGWAVRNEQKLQEVPAQYRPKPELNLSPLPRIVPVRGLRALNEGQRAMFDQLPESAQKVARGMLLVEKPDVSEVVHYMAVVLKDEAWRVAA